jgi:hypothetical protein
MAYESGKDVEFARLSYRLRIANPKKTTPLFPDKRELYKIIKELIIEGQACGEIRQDLNSVQLATAVLYSARGVVYSWCLPDTEFDLKQMCEDVFEVLLEGLRKK